MEFNSRITRQKTIPTEPGSKFAPTYEIKLDEDGHKRVHKSGETNIYQRIQEALPETLIQNILDRAALGDPEALNRHNANYIDATEMPKTLQEAQNTIIRIQNEFDDLPTDTKRKFDFSVDKYVAEYGTETWLENMGYTVKDGNLELKKPELKNPDSTEPKEEPKNE